MTAEPKGLFTKYTVTKADGSHVDPKALYFVLRYDKDRHARVALWSYAISVMHENPQLASELIETLEPVMDDTDRWRITSARRMIAERR